MQGFRHMRKDLLKSKRVRVNLHVALHFRLCELYATLEEARHKKVEFFIFRSVNCTVEFSKGQKTGHRSVSIHMRKKIISQNKMDKPMGIGRTLNCFVKPVLKCFVELNKVIDQIFKMVLRKFRRGTN